MRGLGALLGKLHRGKFVVVLACILGFALGVRHASACCSCKGANGTMGDCTYIGNCPLKVGCLQLKCTAWCGIWQNGVYEQVCSGIGCPLEYCSCGC
jgi:hypothetical protein